jgi:hypothetical protein
MHKRNEEQHCVAGRQAAITLFCFNDFNEMSFGDFLL